VTTSAACRAFLSQVDLESVAADRGHPASCAACAQRVEAAHRIAGLLRGLPRPTVPAELASDAFLDRIADEIAAASQSRLHEWGVIAELERAVPARELPAPELSVPGDSLSRAVLARLDTSAAPGLIWPRLRADLRSVAAGRRRRSFVARFGLAAAALLAATAVWFTPGDDRRVHRPAPSLEPQIVFVRVDRPLATGYSPEAILRAVVSSDAVSSAAGPGAGAPEAGSPAERGRSR
jgi:hypothetical protein